jgi:hypothetical protein
MTVRRGASVAAVAGIGAVTTILLGLVTNAVSQQSRWPAWLRWLQEHPWLSFVVLGAVTAGLAALLAVLDDRWGRGQNLGPIVRPDDDTALPGAALVLRSLPRDTTVFTDRSTELDSLVRSVRTAQESGEALPVHVIDGMPGAGKTAFAVHAGHVLSERFPDGQLFLNLNGHTPGRSPVQAGEALASLLAAAGVPSQQIPVGDDIGAVTEARAAMWRSRLADKKALLILDNAASYRQLEPLLPGGGECLVRRGRQHGPRTGRRTCMHVLLVRSRCRERAHRPQRRRDAASARRRSAGGNSCIGVAGGRPELAGERACQRPGVLPESEQPLLGPAHRPRRTRQIRHKRDVKEQLTRHAPLVHRRAQCRFLRGR